VLSRRVMMRTLFGGTTAMFLTPANAASDALKDGSFRKSVIALLSRRHPEWRIEPETDPESIAIGDNRLYLGNLYLRVKTMSDADRESEILAFFENSLTVTNKASPADEAPFASARQLLRPQIVPAKYLQTAADLIHRPFLADLIVVYALDDDRTYQLLQQAAADKWHAGREEIEKFATENLEALSLTLPLKVSPNNKAGAFLAVGTKDGYDAARLLMPQFMKRVRAALNAPTVFAGIPNRDFLVVWTPDFDPRRGFAARIAKDAIEQPHSLTDALFVSSDSGVRLANAAELKDHGR
jgi:hypothetical protein